MQETLLNSLLLAFHRQTLDNTQSALCFLSFFPPAEDPEPAKRLKLVCQPVQAPAEQGAAEEPVLEEAHQPIGDAAYPVEGAAIPGSG